MAQTQILNVIGSLGGVGNAAAALASTLTGGAPGAWMAAIRQASYKGVPFGVFTADTQFGRKNAVHSYPQRDGVWIEDLGRKARLLHVNAFLIENSLVYGGGPVNLQRQLFIAAFEGDGPGELVHPTLGRVKVAGISGECHERWDGGRYFELNLTFIEQGDRLYPLTGTSTGNAVTAALGLLGSASLTAFVNDTAAALQFGSAVISANVTAALGWYTGAVGLVHDVKRFFGSVSTLVNSTSTVAGSYGRYFGGSNSGFAPTRAVRTGPTTVDQLIANDAAARTALDQAGSALTAAAGNPSDAATYSAAAATMAGALASSAADPSDRLRLTLSLATYDAHTATTSSPVGGAIATMQTAATDLFTRASLVEVASAAAAYQPSSEDDASNVSGLVSDALDAAIENAGNTGSDEVFTALTSTKKAVVADLKARGGALAAIVPYTFNASMPSLVLAQRIYRDPSRADDLVQQANPVHPCFMPTNFNALAR
jgi:prophage DNA circulation protein